MDAATAPVAVFSSAKDKLSYKIVRQKAMKPPSKSELAGPPPISLDADWMLKNFLGKTIQDVLEMCRQQCSITEDFAYMTAKGLNYYLPAAINYLESDDSEGDWGFAHGLMCSLATQVGVFGLRGEPLILIDRIAEYCDKHRDKFNIEVADLLDDYLTTIRKAEQTSPGDVATRAAPEK